MTLTETEQAFIDRFNQGVYIPILLFSDRDILKRIEHHPMIIWRLQHNQTDSPKR